MESYMLKTNCRGPYTLLQTGLPIITQFTCMGSSLISKITFPNLPPPQVDRNYMVGAIYITIVYICIDCQSSISSHMVPELINNLICWNCKGCIGKSIRFVPILVPLWGSCSHFVPTLFPFLSHFGVLVPTLFPLCSHSCPAWGFLFPVCSHSCPTLGFLFPLCSHFVRILVPLWGSCSHFVPTLVPFLSHFGVLVPTLFPLCSHSCPTLGFPIAWERQNSLQNSS